eukprot:6212155-Pleurochrysis_carterae.AAC.1
MVIVETQGSEPHCVKPKSRSHGKSECRQRTGTPVGADRGVPGRRVAVHDFVVFEVALQVCSDKIPSPHAHAGGAGDGSESSQGCGSHRGAERLVVVHTVGLRTSLHTQASLEDAAALALVDSDEPDEGSTGRDLRANDCCPTIPLEA